MILAKQDEIGLDDLPAEVRSGAVSTVRSHVFDLPEEGCDLEEVEMYLIRQALERSGGNPSKAAKLLGLTQKTIEARMRRFGL